MSTPVIPPASGADQNQLVLGVTPAAAAQLYLRVTDNADGTGTLNVAASANLPTKSANDATNTTAVPAATATDTVIKASAGRLVSILVTATGTANVLIYDNASGHTGTVIGVIKSTAVIGDIIVLAMPAANGITVAGAAANAGFTAAWA